MSFMRPPFQCSFRLAGSCYRLTKAFWPLLTVLLLDSTVLAQAFDERRAVSIDFDNPPLRYTGPDPTSEYFLPGVASPGPRTEMPGNAYSRLHTGPLGPPRDSFAKRQPISETPSDFMTAQPAARWIPGNPGGQGGPPFVAPNDPISFGGATTSDDFYVEAHGNSGSVIREHKDGFFQKVSFAATWINRNSKADDFGETELDLFATFALPAPTRDWPLLITPAFNTRLLDGPDGADIPPRLYETYLDFTWVPRLSARWTAILGVAPGAYSDFETSEDAFRMTGKVLARYNWHLEQVQLLFGVLYLDRYDITWLPAGGIIWKPSPGRNYEFVFPKPKLAHRIQCAATFEDWVYLGGEIGGNSYATESVGAVTLRGYRAYLGFERRFDGGAGVRFEVGYVFGRELEFESTMPTIEANDAAMVRGAVTY